MNSGAVIGIFALGAAVGALIESMVRYAIKHRIQERFVEQLEEEVRKRAPVPQVDTVTLRRQDRSGSVLTSSKDGPKDELKVKPRVE